MFAERFNPLITKYPQEADALSRLGAYFLDVEQKRGEGYTKIKLDPQRLFEISQAGSSTRLANVISLLISEGLFERVIVVVSPAGGGIQTFQSYADVPNVIRDTRRDVDLEVTDEYIATFYRPAHA